MTKLKVSSLTNKQLDWLVSCLEGNTLDIYRWLDTRERYKDFWYTSNWKQGGPIIEREKINVLDAGTCWGARIIDWSKNADGRSCRCWYGHTPLIAAMRYYVASKLGDEVEIPKDLLDATRDFSIKDIT